MSGPHTIERDEVMAYLDGELPPARAAVVRAHVETCARCRALAADLRDVSARLAEWPIEPTPAVLDVSVRAAIDAAPLVAAPQERRRRSRWHGLLVAPAFRFAGAAAVAAAGILGVWIVARPFVDDRAGDPAISPSAPASTGAAAQSARIEPAEPAEPSPVFRSVVPGPGDPAPGSQKGAEGSVRVAPRQDSVSEVRISGAPIAPPAVPTAAPPSRLEKPPLTTAPPPATPPPPAATTPPVTQTAVTTAAIPGQTTNVAQGQTGAGRGLAAGGGAGGRGGGGRSTTAQRVASESLMVDTSRPLVSRRVEMTIVSNRFDAIRAELERIVADQKGMTSSLTVSPDGTMPRAIETTIRIPVERVAPALASIRALGRLTRDVEAGDDLSPQASALAAEIDRATQQESALQNLLARQSGDREAMAATQQAMARNRENRERLERDFRELQLRAANVFVTLRVEEGK
jgi:hypothetical protein